MADPANHYRALGVRPDADTHTIRHAYVQLARRYHPDFHVEASTDDLLEAKRMIRVANEAWRVLGHAERRRDYDSRLRRSGDPVFRTDASGQWVAYDSGDDGDPRDLLDDRPIGKGGRPPSWLTVLPIVLAGVAVLLLGAAALLDSTLVFGAAIACFGVAGLMFVVVPLVALARSERDPA